MSEDRDSTEDVVCSCCGRDVAAGENVLRGEIPYPGDLGTGLCRTCGGNPEAKASRERSGDAVTMFVDARIPIVARLLSEENRCRFLSLEYELQAAFVLRCVAKGILP